MSYNTYLPEGASLNTSQNKLAMRTLDELEGAMRDGLILEGIVKSAESTLTLSVELGGFVGTMEKNEVQLTFGEPVKDIAVITRVGKPICFKIIKIEPQRFGAPRITLSRRAAQLECTKNYLSTLCPGDVIPAKVTHLEHFGAFVDIGCGIVSLLSIDSISVSRISHPSDRLCLGEELSVVVRDIERNDDGLPTRLYVTHRELLGTWEENAALFSVGQTVTGIVRSIESYGVFVELAPNLAGLAEYRDDVSVGQCAAVYIKNIIPERMKIKLVIIDPYRGLSPLTTALVKDTPRHIAHWRYSPMECPRIVETIFDEN